MSETEPARRPPIILRIGHEELVIRRRYEALSIANDVLVGLWFLAGSILFFFAATTVTGTWFFVIGSVELLIRPVIRLSRHLHLRRLPDKSGLPDETVTDY
jgi:hypothetical protein